MRGARGSSWSCFLDKLRLRVSGASASRMGFVVLGLGGGSTSDASHGESGRQMGVDDAMVPPTPAREVATGVILRGAYLVIEHGVGSIVVAGVIKAGLCGEPMAMTKGILELEAALSFRSEGADSRIGSALLEPAEPARARLVTKICGGGVLAMLLRITVWAGGDTMRMVDASDTGRDMGGSCRRACSPGESCDASTGISPREGVFGLGVVVCLVSNNP